MRVLALDSSQGLDLAICEAGQTRVLHQGLLPKVEALLPCMQTALAHQELPVGAVDRLVVVTGPGNYTTLRAGIVALRTWAMVQGTPLFVAARLDMMLYAAALQDPTQVYAPCLNVKQGQWYAGVGQWSGNQATYVQAPGIWPWEQWAEAVAGEFAPVVLHFEPLPFTPPVQLGLEQVAEAAAHWGATQTLEQQASVHHVQPFYIRPAVNLATGH